MGRLDDQVAIITGASRGLGQYCALGFAREGAKVAIAARTTEEQDPRLPGTIYHTAEMISEAGGEAFPVVCNVAKPESIDEMTQAVLDHWGRVDILMNNAAIQPPGNNSDIQLRHWNLIFNVNVHGPFYCVRAVFMLKRQRGNIINISSYATLGGSPYGATKRALEAMTAAGRRYHRQRAEAGWRHRNTGIPFAQVPREGRQQSDIPELPPPDSYVEAAVLLACQTTETYTGQVNDDAEVIANLAGEAQQTRLRELNPESWQRAFDAAVKRRA